MYLMIFEIFQIILRRKRFFLKDILDILDHTASKKIFLKGYSRYSRSYCLGKEMLNDILEIWIILRRKRNLLFLYILDLPAKERDFIYDILDILDLFCIFQIILRRKRDFLCAILDILDHPAQKKEKKKMFYVFQIILRCPGFSYSNKYIRMYDFLKHKQRQYLFWN